MIILIIILKYIDKRNEYKELSNLNLMKISQLDIEFIKLNDVIISNKQMINFNDEYEKIPVNEESKMYIILGNNSNRLHRYFSTVSLNSYCSIMHFRRTTLKY